MGELAIAHSLITVWINSAVLGLQPRTARKINRLKGVLAGMPSGYATNQTPGFLLLSLFALAG